MTDYQDPYSCNKCSGLNKVTGKDYINGYCCEAKTECTICGFKDYWAYGFYESSSDMVSKCKTYNFENKNG